MVNKGNAQLDSIFSALSDPTRRALIARLAENPRSISDLARPLPMSLPAVMKHLDVLEGAGLIVRQKQGRTVTCRLAPAPMATAMQWLTHYQHFWSEGLDRLAALVERQP